MPTVLWRFSSWAVVFLLFAFLINNYLIIWRDWPGLTALFNGDVTALAWGNAAIYLAAVGLAYLHVSRHKERTLREDSDAISDVSAYIVRAAFLMVLLVGFTDAFISFLRVENLLVGVAGSELATELGRPEYRMSVVHAPLILASIVIAFFVRSLGFTWLALLVVVAELMIVFSRFVFSYEQAFMGDLVRFWYAGLFLFASAYTLLEEGHVRVDVLYAGFSQKVKGAVNAVGSVALGATLCVVVLIIGMADKTNIINAPIVSFEVSQSGYGMYVKYLMAAFLGIFAATMLIQFAAALLWAIADYRGEPGAREIGAEIAH